MKNASARLGITLLGAGMVVAASAELSNFSVAGYSMEAGSKTPATAMLTSMTKSPIPIVSFKSSNTAVAQVPLSKLASSNGTVVIDVTGVAPGCATITASYGGRSRIDDLVVHPAPQTTAFTMKVPDQIVIYPSVTDGVLTKTVSLSTSGDRTVSGGTLTINPVVWSLSSNNPSIVAVPESVTQVSTNTAFKMTAKGEGCAIITAKLGNQSVSKTVMTRYIGG